MLVEEGSQTLDGSPAPILLASNFEDKWWRLNTLYKIIDKDANLTTFIPNRIQAVLYKRHHNRNIILKARQLGITTFAAIDMLDDVLFTPNFSAVLIAHKYDAMTEIFKKVQLAWRYLDDDVKKYFGWQSNTDNRNQLSFNNESSITITLSSRSGTVNRLHVSEFGILAHESPDKVEEILTGAFPSVVPQGRIDIESTAKGGARGEFYEMYMEAEKRGQPKNEKEFKAFFFPWTLDARYALDPRTLSSPISEDLRTYQRLHRLTDEQTAWYVMTQKEQGNKCKSEFPTVSYEAFESSADIFFDDQNLTNRLARDVTQPTILNGWEIFESYQRGHRYGMGVDVAEGINKDDSACVIIDFSHRKDFDVVPKVVAKWKDNMTDPLTLAYVCREGAQMYGNCIVAVERNNHGHATLGKLKEIYGNIYKQVSKDDITNRELEKLGWHTTVASKPEILMQLKNAINQNLLLIADKYMLLELKAYTEEDYKRVKFDNRLSKHFDVTMALAIAWEMRSYATEGGDGSVEITTEELSDPHSMFQV